MGNKKISQPTIGELFYRIRNEFGDGQESQKKMAEKIGVSRSMITHIEKYNSVPNESVLQKTAFHYGRDQWERDFLLRELRKAALFSREPETFAVITSENMEGGNRIEMGEFLPLAIRNIIEHRVLELGIEWEKIAEDSGVPLAHLKVVLRGEGALSREALRNLALSLGEDPESWLLFCGYVPENMQTLFRQKPVVTRLYKKIGFLSETQKELFWKKVEAMLDDLISENQ